MLSWSSNDGLAQTIQSTSAFYRIAFAWDAPTGRAQRVELRTKNKDLKIKTSPWLRAK